MVETGGSVRRTATAMILIHREIENISSGSSWIHGWQLPPPIRSSMGWQRLAPSTGRRRRRSRFHLDESVPRSVEEVLGRHGYSFSTTRQLQMAGRPDPDQAALCWRENRTLLTFDWDFFDARVIPRHRAPGIVIVDCDSDREHDVALAVRALGEYERLRGAVSRRTRIVVRSDGEVRALTETTLPCATRANPQGTGCARVQLATLYRSLS